MLTLALSSLALANIIPDFTQECSLQDCGPQEAAECVVIAEDRSACEPLVEAGYTFLCSAPLDGGIAQRKEVYCLIPVAPPDPPTSKRCASAEPVGALSLGLLGLSMAMLRRRRGHLDTTV